MTGFIAALSFYLVPLCVSDHQIECEQRANSDSVSIRRRFVPPLSQTLTKARKINAFAMVDCFQAAGLFSGYSSGIVFLLFLFQKLTGQCVYGLFFARWIEAVSRYSSGRVVPRYM